MASLGEDFRNRYLLLGIATGPASEDDIDRAESAFGITFPPAYRAFLLVCGMQPPKSLVGSDCTLEDLATINSEASSLFTENNITGSLVQNIFVFLMHQGYSLLYFPLNGNVDPPVYCYNEGDPSPVLVESQLSDWVASVA